MKESGKPRILLIVPAFNEEDNILKAYRSVQDYNSENGTDYDIIVINDGSTDGTEKVLTENDIPHIRLVSNLGIGGAVQTGYKYAWLHGYDIAIQYDGDGQHDIAFVPALISPILKGEADMVIGSRFVDGNEAGFQSSAARRAGIKIISVFIKLKTGNKIYDTTSGFRAVGKDLIRKFAKRYPLEYPEPISTTAALMNGYSVLEVPVKMKEREAGKSSIRLQKNAYYMINVILNILCVGKGDLNE